MPHHDQSQRFVSHTFQFLVQSHGFVVDNVARAQESDPTGAMKNNLEVIAMTVVAERVAARHYGEEIIYHEANVLRKQERGHCVTASQGAAWRETTTEMSFVSDLGGFVCGG